MERNLEQVLEETMMIPNVFGCIFVDHQGLCLGVKGDASAKSAGIIAAIAEQAQKLEPKSRQPLITFEGDTKSCVVEKNKEITGAVYVRL